MANVAALGDLLVDFTPAGKSGRGNGLFECNPGGGVANLAVAMAHAGQQVSFIGKVGDDSFGHILAGAMAGYGVDTRGIAYSGEHLTTLAFVHLFESGERDFTFYRRPGPDAVLTWEEVDTALLDQCALLHVSSLTMTTPTGRDTTHQAVEYARARGKLVTYDPNLRPMLWASPEASFEAMRGMLPHCDVAKLSDEEAAFLLPGLSEEAAAAQVLSQGPKLLFISKGEAGAAYYCAQGSGLIPAVPADAVDTTGAGDCFFGNTLAKMLDVDIRLSSIDISALESCIRYGVAAASLCVRVKGGMPSMPYSQAVEALLRA